MRTGIRGLAWFSIAASLIAAITIYSVIYYQVTRDTDAYLHRAQVAANAEDMIEYLQTYKQNIEKRGMTTGHFALILKKADNDLSLHYQTLNRILERLEAIKGLPQTEPTYQVALDDIRGTLRELRDPGGAWVWTHYWWISLIMIVVLIFSALVIFFVPPKSYFW